MLLTGPFSRHNHYKEKNTNFYLAFLKIPTQNLIGEKEVGKKYQSLSQNLLSQKKKTFCRLYFTDKVSD